MLSFSHTTIHRDGWRFIGVFAGVACLLFLMSKVLGFIGLLLTAWCTYFFRDPQRVVPQKPDIIVSPADGLVQAITTAPLPKEVSKDDTLFTRVSIFLNVFDVHINRIPCEGTIQKIAYHKGLFFNASLDKASEHNERNTITVETPSGKAITFVQIAGLIARRIRCDVVEGQAVKAGERYGIIRFGSRVDVYLPEGISPQVVVGQRMISGETIIADLSSQEPARIGEVI